MKYVLFFSLLFSIAPIAACSNGNQAGTCECALNDGVKDFQVACGETYCVGTRGYMCASEQNVVDTSCTPSAGPDAPIAQPAKYKGTVDIELRPPYRPNGSPSFDVAGGFVTRDACRHSTVAGCEITQCDYPLSLSDFAAPGKVSVGPTRAGGNYSWTPGARWLSFSADTVDWAVGAAVNVSWTGDVVPAAAMSLPSPATAEFDSYPITDIIQPHNQDRALRWRAIGDPVVVRLTQKRDAGVRTVECPFPAGSSAGTIAGSVLVALPKTGNAYDYEEEILAVTSTVQRVGDFAVTMRVLRGVGASQLVTFDQ